MPISVSRGHFALRYEVPKFLARGGHLCMAMLTIAEPDVYYGPSEPAANRVCMAAMVSIDHTNFSKWPPLARTT